MSLLDLKKGLLHLLPLLLISGYQKHCNVRRSQVPSLNYQSLCWPRIYFWVKGLMIITMIIVKKKKKNNRDSCEKELIVLIFSFVWFLAALCGMQDLSSLTRDQTHMRSGSEESKPLDH